MTLSRSGRTQPACRRRRHGRLASVVLTITLALVPVAAQSPTPLNSALGAQLEEKIAGILRHAEAASRETRLTTLLEPEINAYLRVQGAPLLPEGLSDPTIHIEDNQRVTVDAIIDLDAIREQRQRNWLDPLQYLGGRMPVIAQGTVTSSDGAAQVSIERITISGVPMPVQVLQELVGYYTRTPDQPEGTRLDQPIPLPYGISELRLAPGEAVIVQ
jgi:hypothetical protein